MNASAAALAAEPGSDTSYNGWPVGSPGSTIGVGNYTVPGTGIVLPVKSGDVGKVLMYVAQRFNAEVETLQGGQCWGYSYRANVNNPSVWSNHASGTAIDLNSAIHPNGARYTFSTAQTVAVRRILTYCGDVIYWGQDYSGTVDGMHFEIDVPPGDARLSTLVLRMQWGQYWTPGAAAYVDGSGGYHVFSVGDQGNLIEMSYSGGTSWKTKDVSNGGFIVGTPAVTYKNGRCDVFGIGSDARIWQMTRYDGKAWSVWGLVGGSQHIAGLEAVIDAAGTYRVFGVNTASNLRQFLGNNGAGWIEQDISVGGSVHGTPAVTYRNGRFDIFALGGDNMVWHQVWTDGAGWAGWKRISNERISGGLEAIQDAAGVYRVFGSTPGNILLEFYSYNGDQWSVYNANNGRYTRGTPAVIEKGNRLEVFSISDDYAMWQQTSVNSTQFQPWWSIGGYYP